VSDQPHGEGWWQASDGKWYPSDQDPRRHPSDPPPQPTPAPPPDREARIKENRTKARRRGCLTVLLGGVGLIALIAVIASLASDGDDDEPSTVPPDDQAAGADAAAASGAPGAAGDADEIDDVGPCTVVDGETIRLDVTNNSSEQSSYLIDVNFLDDAGQRTADETFFVNFVRPGEHAVEDTFAFEAEGAAGCEIAEVDRLSAQSPDDVAEVACQVTGVDALGDIATSLTATNGSSELSDYSITASLVREGVRIGTVTALIENVPAGESAPGEGPSIVDGPAEGVICEVVHVERTSSE
jgi:hypothetical protein